MEFRILAHEFWSKTAKFHANDARHIKYMDDKLYDLGLQYIDTSYSSPKKPYIYLTFKIINEENFFLAKLKYGI